MTPSAWSAISGSGSISAALRVLGDGLAWAPGSFFTQDGSPDPYCSRGTLAASRSVWPRPGFDALVGHEMEFVLVGPDGARLPSDLWAQYGLAGVLEHEGFVRDVMEAAAASGVAIEQFHPEYGANQFEISLAPLAPVAAADQLVLMRIIVGRVARQYGVRVSLSPVPFAGSVGSGAHQHFSLHRDGAPLFAGGPGARGMTPPGEVGDRGTARRTARGPGRAVRLDPVRAADAARLLVGRHVCWGTENREAAVRFVHGGDGNPHGANVEVKVVDPSANPYFATAAILGLALDGIERNLPLAAGSHRRSRHADRRPARRSRDDAAAERSGRGHRRARRICARQADSRDAAVDAIVAVRRYEHENYGDLTDDELAQKFRMAWSV